MRAFKSAATLGTLWIVFALPSGAQAPSEAGNEAATAAQVHAYLRDASESMHKNDLATAAHALRLALDVDPHSMAALNNLGIVLVRQGKPAEAIPFYERALAL